MTAIVLTSSAIATLLSFLFTAIALGLDIFDHISGTAFRKSIYGLILLIAIGNLMRAEIGVEQPLTWLLIGSFVLMCEKYDHKRRHSALLNKSVVNKKEEKQNGHWKASKAH